MTVNDGLPLDEPSNVDGPLSPAGHITDPPTDMLPAGAVDQANQPTQVLPVGSPADSATEGSVEGDLFDGLADR